MQKELLKEDGPKCGCGRSPTGYCVGWHSLSEEELKKAIEDNSSKMPQDPNA